MGKGSGGGSGPGYHLRGGHAPPPESATQPALRRYQGEPPLLSPAISKQKRSTHQYATSPPPKGLLNIGNSCYANSVLQCLLSTALTHALIDPKASEIFRRYSSNPRLLEQGSGSVDSQDHEKVSDRRRKEREDRLMQENCSWLTRELKIITLQYQQETPRQSGISAWLSPSRAPVLDPGSITKYPDRLSKCLRPYQQEDAHEFLRALLSTLVMNGRNKELSSLFDGLLESAVTCLTCRRPSLTRDRYMDLSLDICGSHVTTLQDALEEFTGTETLQGDNKVYCQKCECKRNATKGLRLATAPSILVVHLKRFAFDSNGRLVRLSKLVNFPLVLEIGNYMSRVNKARPPPYELVAVLVHQGQSCEYGHYVAFTRHAGQWYKCNDSQVEQVSVETVLKQQAYILVYEVEEMRSKHGYASPSGKGCKSHCSNGSEDWYSEERSTEFMKLLSSSLCGLDDLMLQDFCWDVSDGMCQRDSLTSNVARRRRRHHETSRSHRTADLSATFDAHDDLSTLGEATVDTTDTNKVPFRRSCSSGNLKQMERSRDKISHSTGRSSQLFYLPDSNDVNSKNETVLMSNNKKQWLEAKSANSPTSRGLWGKRRSDNLPPRPKASRLQRPPIAQPEPEDDKSEGVTDEAAEGLDE